MGTAKYDHPGYLADAGAAGTYHVGVWCPHGYPAHVHIGRAGSQDDARLRLRIPDGVFQSMPDDMETLCRRAFGQALAEACWPRARRFPGGPAAPGRPALNGPLAAAHSPERGYPQAMWTTLGIGCAHLPNPASKQGLAQRCSRKGAEQGGRQAPPACSAALALDRGGIGHVVIAVALQRPDVLVARTFPVVHRVGGAPIRTARAGPRATASACSARPCRTGCAIRPRTYCAAVCGGS